MNKAIINGKLVLPDQVTDGTLIIEDGRIKHILREQWAVTDQSDIINAGDLYVLPGLVDIHSDAIEKEIEPRPNTLFPFEMSFYELEKKLAACGITTMYHSLSFGDGVGVRDCDRAIEVLKNIHHLRSRRTMINHALHLRYEVLYLEGLAIVKELIDSGMVDYLSFMNHTPGQGQYAQDEQYAEYAEKVWGVRGDETKDFLQGLKDLNQKVDWQQLKKLAQLAHAKGIHTASHDDDTIEKVYALQEWGIKVSEFPVTLETAKYAHQIGLYVCVGAPNVIRGKSHSNNMRAMDAIREGCADILCSDYLPTSLLAAVFAVHSERIGLPQAVNMVSLNPARAVGIDRETGSLEEGKRADLILVELRDKYPLVRQTLSRGVTVYEGNYREA
ncbi:MAG: phosphonate metabolism protein PhnM [Bacillota bacterium]